MSQLEQDDSLNGEKYFNVFKLCIETNQKGIMEFVLINIEKILKENYVSETQDNQIADSILQMISKCSNENSDSMLRLVLNVIMAMLNNN